MKKEKLINFIRKSLNPLSWTNIFKSTIISIPKRLKDLYYFTSFFLLLLFFILNKFYLKLEGTPFVGKLFIKLGVACKKKFDGKPSRFLSRIERTKSTEMKRTELIEIAYMNLLSKKTRTAVTILGMSVGVGVIVFLLSFGYGIERLIINQVASLDDLKIINVTTGTSSNLRLDNRIINQMKTIPHVDKVMPSVSLVGRLDFKNASTDVVAYSESNEYMKQSHVRLIKGNWFSNNNTYSYMGPDVAGVSIQLPSVIQGSLVSNADVYFNVSPEAIAYEWSSCDTSSQIVGVAARITGGLDGKEYWGGYYNSNDDSLQGVDGSNGSHVSKWIKAEMPLFYQTGDGNVLPYLDNNGVPKWQNVCVEEKELQINQRISFASVLGASTSSASLTNNLSSTDGASLSFGSADATQSALSALGDTVISTNSAGIEIVSLQPVANLPTSKVIPFKTGSSKTAIVNLALLRLFGIDQNSALDKSFNATFTISQSLIPSVQIKAVTDTVSYAIVGVTDDNTTPYFYIPLHDMNSLGIANFSQVKIIVSDKAYVSDIRKKIESMGFTTTSTLDTVSQIESLFANLQIILALLGLVALGVASLGMFNTLTVSLLERTREIGGMKTMGMVSDEVQDLFLSEAMMMGMAGGFGGLVLGFLAGKILSFLVSILALANGQGFLDLTYIPPYLIIFIIVSSFIVGTVTGLFPSRRAKGISALNALRYE